MQSRWFWIRIAVGLVVAWLLGWLFTELAEELRNTILGDIERTVLAILAANRRPALTDVMLVFTYIGTLYGYVVVSLVAFIVCWRRGRRLEAVMVPVVAIGAGIISTALKAVYHRTRPDIMPVLHAPLTSYPSGHALAVVAVYGFIAYIIQRRVHWYWKVVVWALYAELVFLIGFSRIYLGVHWPTDVLGGMPAGAAWLIACISAYHVLQHLGERWRRRSQGGGVRPG